MCSLKEKMISPRLKKPLIITSVILALYILSFLLLPMRILIVFMYPDSVNEQVAKTFLPPIHWSTEFTRTNTEQSDYVLKTKTLNVFAIYKEVELKKYWLAMSVFSQAVPQGYPYQFQNVYYYPLWLIVNNYLIR